MATEVALRSKVVPNNHHWISSHLLWPVVHVENADLEATTSRGLLRRSILLLFGLVHWRQRPSLAHGYLVRTDWRGDWKGGYMLKLFRVQQILWFLNFKESFCLGLQVHQRRTLKIDPSTRGFFQLNPCEEAVFKKILSVDAQWQYTKEPNGRTSSNRVSIPKW